MPLHYGTTPEENKTVIEPPELDADALAEIQDESERLAEMIKNVLVRIKRNKQTQRQDGAKVYHQLNDVNKAIRNADATITRIIEND